MSSIHSNVLEKASWESQKVIWQLKTVRLNSWLVDSWIERHAYSFHWCGNKSVDSSWSKRFKCTKKCFPWPATTPELVSLSIVPFLKELRLWPKDVLGLCESFSSISPWNWFIVLLSSNLVFLSSCLGLEPFNFASNFCVRSFSSVRHGPPIGFVHVLHRKDAILWFFLW